jgi:hypothetical protein
VRLLGISAVCLVIVGFDVLVMQQLVWSALGLAVVAVIVGVHNLRHVAVPALAMGLSVGLVAGNNRLAEARARALVEVVERYRADHGEYPEDLEQLVPDYLPAIPRAKQALMFADFQYWTYEGEHTLMWTVLPPFGRRLYRFEDRQWGGLD